MSAELKELKAEFRRTRVRYGGTVPCTTVTPELQDKWLKKLYGSKKPPLPENPRRINHFMLGADPEFIFETHDGLRVDATSLGLKTGRFIGADQNGRLVEARPRASKFALAVIGSLLAELRWLPALCPKVRYYHWIAGAFLHGDGIGGHVHFGRKRNLKDIDRFIHEKADKPEETAALDRLALTLYMTNMFPKKQVQRRMAGDERGQLYGQYGDMRVQIHGYEYRTLPTWLDSPLLAYLIVTLSKLAVIDPEIVAGWNVELAPRHIKDLLAYYKGRDDDAWIAYYALIGRPLPEHNGDHFAPRWGIISRKTPPQVPKVWPSSIKASKEDLEDLYAHFVEGKEIPDRVPTPTWAPTEIPKGYALLSDFVETRGKAGLGETIWDAVFAEPFPMQILAGDEQRSALRVSKELATLLPQNWEEQLKKIAPEVTVSRDKPRRGVYEIYIGKQWRAPIRLLSTRKALFSGIFPLWKAKDLKDDSLKAWMMKAPKQPAEKTYGTILVNREQ